MVIVELSQVLSVVAVAAIVMAVYVVAVAMKLHGSTDPEYKLLRLFMFAVFEASSRRC